MKSFDFKIVIYVNIPIFMSCGFKAKSSICNIEDGSRIYFAIFSLFNFIFLQYYYRKVGEMKRRFDLNTTFRT